MQILHEIGLSRLLLGKPVELIMFRYAELPWLVTLKPVGSRTPSTVAAGRIRLKSQASKSLKNLIDLGASISFDDSFGITNANVHVDEFITAETTIDSYRSYLTSEHNTLASLTSTGITTN